MCGACERSLPRAPRERRYRAAFAYAFPVDRLILRFKFAGDLALGRWLALRLAGAVRGEPRPDLLVAPPLARRRLHRRGFNQAHEIAKAIGRELGVPVAHRGLARRRETAAQSKLSRAQRRANLRGAFECRLDLRGRRVAVVDDVLTTGATADALASVLRSRGARHVAVWVVARTPRPGQ